MNQIVAINSTTTPEQLAARAALYQVFSNLMAGPDLADMDNGDYWSATVEMLEAGTKALPYDFQSDTLVTALKALSDKDRQALKTDFSRYFEVGSDGVKLPIREELSEEKTISKKEELVRFYEFFGYELEEEFQWQPDHLALELEFVSFLIEGQWSQTETERQQSLLLAQRDFCQRHILSWVPALAEQAQDKLPKHFFSKTLAACQQFLNTDFDWLEIQTAALRSPE